MQIEKYTTALIEAESKERKKVSSLLGKLGEQQNAERNEEMNNKIQNEITKSAKEIREKYEEEYGARRKDISGSEPLKKILKSLLGRKKYEI